MRRLAAVLVTLAAAAACDGGGTAAGGEDAAAPADGGGLDAAADAAGDAAGDAPGDAAGDVGDGSGDVAPPDAGPPAPLPFPLALGACEVVEAGFLPGDVDEPSGLAALPGVVGANGRELLVTHGDNGLTLDFVDPGGVRDGRLKVIGAGDFEAVTVLSVTKKGSLHHMELAALESPGNLCTRGDGVCTDGHVVRLTVAAQPGSYALLGEPVQWALPPKERTNAECLEQVGGDLLLFAKNTADKYRVHLQPGVATAVLEPLVRQEDTDAQGKLTDLTHDPATGRLLATSRDGAALLVEIAPKTWEPLHVSPIPAPLGEEKVEGIAVLADQTIVLVSEAGSIRRYACK